MEYGDIYGRVAVPIGVVTRLQLGNHAVATVLKVKS
jgi:hypothetical protein